MPEKEILLGVLESTRKRIRSNDRLREAAAALSVCLCAPILFKLIDLVYPFRGRTVALFLRSGRWRPPR